MTPAVIAGVLLILGYLAAESRLHRRGDGWPIHRSAAAAGTGFSTIAAGLVPGDGFPGEVTAHLLATMLAPLLFALAAPVTLVLRVADVHRWPRRTMLAVLHSRWVRGLTWWPVLLILDIGGLCLAYLSPLAHRPGWHLLLMAHMAATGWVFDTWLVGVDPVVDRPGVMGRAAVLIVVLAAHDVVAKVLFAQGGGVGAQLLFYGGDAVEVATAIVLFWGWYADAGRAQRHARRRQLMS
ncbi:MAG: cytochrome c oxidase assembly protein [Janthinobacterium lividum]